MIKILLLVLMCILFTSMSIFANCDKVTGGACNIEDLKKEQEMLDKIKPIDKMLENSKENILNESIKSEIPKTGKKDILYNEKTKNEKTLE